MKYSNAVICVAMLNCVMTVNAATPETQVTSVATADLTSPATWVAQEITTSKFAFSVLVI